jgi:hypothetical protein
VAISSSSELPTDRDTASFLIGPLPDDSWPQQFLFRGGDRVLITAKTNDDGVHALQPGHDTGCEKGAFA